MTGLVPAARHAEDQAVARGRSMARGGGPWEAQRLLLPGRKPWQNDTAGTPRNEAAPSASRHGAGRGSRRAARPGRRAVDHRHALAAERLRHLAQDGAVGDRRVAAGEQAVARSWTYSSLPARAASVLLVIRTRSSRMAVRRRGAQLPRGRRPDREPAARSGPRTAGPGRACRGGLTRGPARRSTVAARPAARRSRGRPVRGGRPCDPAGRAAGRRGRTG